MAPDFGPGSEELRVLGVLPGTRSTASDLFRSWVQADTVSDLVDATPGACAQFVQSLGLPELKAKRLLAALGGVKAHGEVPPAILAIKHTRIDVCPSCHGLWWVPLPLPPASDPSMLFAGGAGLRPFRRTSARRRRRSAGRPVLCRLR